MGVTKDQAAAFIDALCGYQELTEDTYGVPHSIGATHHLGAVLGLSGLPAGRIMRDPLAGAGSPNRERLVAFRDYLVAVVEVVTDHLGDKGVDWLEFYKGRGEER